MGWREDARLGAFLIEGNDAAERLADSLALLEESLGDAEALGSGIDACRRLARGAGYGPVARRLAERSASVARCLAEALNGRRPLDGGELAVLAVSGAEIRALLARLEAER